MAKNPAPVQVDTASVKASLQSTSAVINAAASFSITDHKKLLALVQSRDTPAFGDEAAAEADEVALGGHQLRPSTRPQHEHCRCA